MRDVDFGPGPIRGVLPTRWIGGDNRWRWRRRSAWNRSVVFVFLAAREREGDDRVSDLAAVGVHGSAVVAGRDQASAVIGALWGVLRHVMRGGVAGPHHARRSRRLD